MPETLRGGWWRSVTVDRSGHSNCKHIHPYRPDLATKRSLPRERIAALCTRLLGAVNIVLGSVGYLHVIMLVMFAGPAGIFATGIKEIFDDAYREAKEDRP